MRAVRGHKKKYPDGDYGQLFWHPQTRTAHFVVGDAAGGYKDARATLEAVPGVAKVVVADEYFPPRGEPGWIQLVGRG